MKPKRKMSISLGLVPVGRPKDDPVRKRAEKLIPIVRKPKEKKK